MPIKLYNMGYDFSGIITNVKVDDLLKESKLKWNFIKPKEIDKPFSGLALLNYVTTSYGCKKEYEEDYDIRQEQQFKLENELPEFSKKFPNIVFVFICVECFGGECIYLGFSCINGSIIDNTDNLKHESKEVDFQTQKLKVLLKHFNVKLNDIGYFEPFSRGYFERSNS